MKTRTIHLTGIIIMLGAISCCAQTNVVGGAVDDADLIATVVNSHCAKYGPQFLVLLGYTVLSPYDEFLRDTTARDEHMTKLLTRSGKIEPETLRNFYENNRHSSRISEELSFEVPHALLQREKHRILRQQPGYKEALANQYQGAKYILSLSSPGYNAARTQAIISVGTGMLGHYVIFEKRKGKWIEIGRVQAWIV